MPWNVVAHPDLPIVETVYSGTLSGAEVAGAAAETLRIAASLGRNRLFADCSMMEGGHTIFDLFFISDQLSLNALGLREAILQPALASSLEKVQFWETACLNRGMQVRIFSRRDEATQWLLE